MNTVIEWHKYSDEKPTEEERYLVVGADYFDVFLYVINTSTDYVQNDCGVYEYSLNDHYTGFVSVDDEGAVFEQTDVLYWAEIPDPKAVVDGHRREHELLIAYGRVSRREGV